MSTLQAELSRGVLQAADLRSRLAVSPATMMRMVRAQGPRIVRIGRARATRYGLREAWQGLPDSRFPLFRIDRQGTARVAGELVTLAARQSVWLPDGGVSNGLPVDVADASPSGFLGRQFATQHPDLGLPQQVSDWSDHHILIALSRRGEDLPGDVLVGDESFARWQRLDLPARTRDDYSRLADETIAGHPPGSSAGGARPKFGAFLGDRHVLVKFAARGNTGDVVTRRWCDLLVLETLALQTIASSGIAAARTTLVESQTHLFLESERFDRVGARGRVAVLSLAAVHDNAADTWARAASVLLDARRLSDADARRLRWLDAFGALTANTDRHQHNVVFFTEGDTLRLAPAFDHVAMFYAPLADGQLTTRQFGLPAATADTLDVWDEARAAAGQFWSAAADDSGLGDEMRRVCQANATLMAPVGRT